METEGFANQDIEDAWATEVERRVALIEARSDELIPAAQAIARARAAIKERQS